MLLHKTAIKATDLRDDKLTCPQLLILLGIPPLILVSPVAYLHYFFTECQADQHYNEGVGGTTFFWWWCQTRDLSHKSPIYFGLIIIRGFLSHQESVPTKKVQNKCLDCACVFFAWNIVNSKFHTYFRPRQFFSIVIELCGWDFVFIVS